MDLFYNVEHLKTKKEKQEYIYTELNKKLGDSVLCSLNPGYFPLNDLVKDERKIVQYYMSLYLSLLDGIDIENKNLLDISCGRGHGAYSYKKYLNIQNVYGMDNSPIAIDFCKNNYKEIKFDLMDLDNIKYPDNFFDIIVCVDTSLWWIVEDSKKLFDNIKRILKRGGVFICGEPMYPDEHYDYLSNIFDHTDVIDITTNVIDSCVDILTHINQYGLNMSEKQYVEYSSFINYRDYKLNNGKFLKYIFRKS